MARVMITIEDSEDEGLTIVMSSDPKIDPLKDLTKAQAYSVYGVNKILEVLEVNDEVELIDSKEDKPS